MHSPSEVPYLHVRIRTQPHEQHLGQGHLPDVTGLEELAIGQLTELPFRFEEVYTLKVLVVVAEVMNGVTRKSPPCQSHCP